MRGLRAVLGLALALGACAVPLPAVAEDAAANFLVRLYIDACVTNTPAPERVRDFAASHGLKEIESREALGVFVGEGGAGSAWNVPSAVGNFALSLRGRTQGCTVWALSADPAAVESLFRALLAGVARPGLSVTLLKDTTDPTPFGNRHTLAYGVSPAGESERGLAYLMQTVERPGGGFQAWLEAAASH